MSSIKTRRQSKGRSTASSIVRLTSYNVLSSHLADPKYHTGCKAEFLDAPYRLKGLLSKLDKEVEARAVICLQEISTPWSGKLHKYFIDNNYYLIAGLYGNKHGGYMGVGTAIPLDTYSIEEINTQKIADTKRMPRKVFPEWSIVGALVGFLSSIYKAIVAYIVKILTYFKIYKPPMKYDLWDSVTYRSNQMVCVRLKHKATGKVFVVGNYHMPCMFELPAVMMAHCALSAQHIHKFAGGDPYIYAGDFNIKPDSSMHQLLTKGSVERTNPDYPVPPEGDNWVCEVEPLRSAYLTANGAEPNFTNFAINNNGPVFCDTLDYIFLSPEWHVDNVLDLPHRDEVEGPFPMETEPSDHILISASLSLPN